MAGGGKSKSKRSISSLPTKRTRSNSTSVSASEDLKKKRTEADSPRPQKNQEEIPHGQKRNHQEFEERERVSSIQNEPSKYVPPFSRRESIASDDGFVKSQSGPTKRMETRSLRRVKINRNSPLQQKQPKIETQEAKTTLGEVLDSSKPQLPVAQGAAKTQISPKCKLGVETSNKSIHPGVKGMAQGSHHKYRLSNSPVEMDVLQWLNDKLEIVEQLGISVFSKADQSSEGTREMDFPPIKVEFFKKAQSENDPQSKKDAKLEKKTNLVNETLPETKVQLEMEVHSEKEHTKEETQLQEAYSEKVIQLDTPLSSGNVANVEKFRITQSLDNAVSLKSSDVAVSGVVICDSDAVSDSAKEGEVWLHSSQQNNLGETQDKVGEITDNVDETPDNVDEITDNVDETPDNVDEITDNVDETPDNVDEITDNVDETPDNVGEITGSKEINPQCEETAAESAKQSFKLLPEGKGTNATRDRINNTSSETNIDTAQVCFNSRIKPGKFTGTSEQEKPNNITSANEDTSKTTASLLKCSTDINVDVPVKGSLDMFRVTEGNEQEKYADVSSTGVLREVTTGNELLVIGDFKPTDAPECQRNSETPATDYLSSQFNEIGQTDTEGEESMDNELLSVGDFKPTVASECQRENEAPVTAYQANQFHDIVQAKKDSFQKEESTDSKLTQGAIHKEEVLTATKFVSPKKTYAQFHKIQQSNQSVRCSEPPTTCTGVPVKSCNSNLSYVGKTLANTSENNEQATAFAGTVSYKPRNTELAPAVAQPLYMSVVKSFCDLHNGNSTEEPKQHVASSDTVSTISAKATLKPLKLVLNPGANLCLNEDNCHNFTGSSTKKDITTGDTDQSELGVWNYGSSDRAWESDLSDSSSLDDVPLSQRIDYNEGSTPTAANLKGEAKQLPRTGSLVIGTTAEMTTPKEEESNGWVDVVNVDTDSSMKAACAVDVGSGVDDDGVVVKAACAVDGGGMVDETSTADDKIKATCAVDDNGVVKAACAVDDKVTCAVDGSGVVGSIYVADDKKKSTCAVDRNEVVKVTCTADDNGVAKATYAVEDDGVVKATCDVNGSRSVRTTRVADSRGSVRSTQSADSRGVMDVTCAVDTTSEVGDCGAMRTIGAADKAIVANGIANRGVMCGVDDIGNRDATCRVNGIAVLKTTLKAACGSEVTNAMNAGTAMEKSDGDMGNVASVSGDLDMNVEELMEVMDFSDSQLIRTAAMATDTAQQSELFEDQTASDPGSRHYTTEGCEMIKGLVKELSALNKYIMQTKREVDIGKRQRQVRMKTFKIKKTLNK